MERKGAVGVALLFITALGRVQGKFTFDVVPQMIFYGLSLVAWSWSASERPILLRLNSRSWLWSPSFTLSFWGLARWKLKLSYIVVCKGCCVVTPTQLIPAIQPWSLLCGYTLFLAPVCPLVHLSMLGKTFIADPVSCWHWQLGINFLNSLYMRYRPNLKCFPARVKYDRLGFTYDLWFKCVQVD